MAIFSEAGGLLVDTSIHGGRRNAAVDADPVAIKRNDRIIGISSTSAAAKVVNTATSEGYDGQIVTIVMLARTAGSYVATIGTRTVTWDAAEESSCTFMYDKANTRWTPISSEGATIA